MRDTTDRRRRGVTTLHAVAVGLVVLALANWRVGPGGPNVILIVVDTLRADHLGCYGYARDTSPELDALAARGMRFTRAYATSSWTGASVASILTGLYPDVHGLDRHDSVLSDEWPLVSEAFRGAGYDTAAVSANPAFVTPEVGFGRGFRRFRLLHGGTVTEDFPGDRIWGNPDMTTLVAVATADRVTDAALDWIRQRRGAPFFLYAHYFDPHASYFPPERFARKFGADPNDALAGPWQRAATFGDIAPANPTVLATLVSLYDGEIAFTDAEIGRLLDGLTDLVTGPTIVVVTADHGEEFGDHGGLQHGSTLFEEQIHVPMLVADHPAGALGLPSGTTIDTPFSLVDVWPLVASVTGMPTTPGRPALALADVAAPGESPPVFADLATNRHRHRWAQVTPRWKLIVQRDQTPLLYDLSEDPGEQRDQAPTDPARAVSLQASLADRHAITERARHAGQAAESTTLTDERRDRLRALGYLQ